MALLIGLVAGNSVFGKPQHQAGIRFTEKYILETAIVLIGFGFNLQVLIDLGLNTFLWLLTSVILVILIALLAGRLSGSSTNFSILLGAGSAICGSAAIAATAPIIKAEERETGLALTLINLLGLLGIAILPVSAMSLNFQFLESGVLTGGVLQSMGHVVAASFSLNTETGEVATVVKMGRIALLIPLLLILYLNQRKGGQAAGANTLKFPLFIFFFVIAVGLSQFGFFPANWAHWLAEAGDFLLIIAMAGIGLKIKLKPLLKISLKGTLAGILVFLFQVLFFIVILQFNLM